MDCATEAELEGAVEPPKARGATLEAVIEDPKSSFTATEEAAVVFNPNPREGVDGAANPNVGAVVLDPKSKDFPPNPVPRDAAALTAVGRGNVFPLESPTACRSPGSAGRSASAFLLWLRRPL